MRISAKLTKKRQLDLCVTILIVIAAIFLCLQFKPNFLLDTLLFFGLPSGYLIIRKPSNLKKSLISGLLFGVLWGFSFDFLAEFNQAWAWSNGNSLVFPGFFFGVVSIDIMIWFFLWIFLAVAFYEYFIEYDFSKRISPNIKASVYLGSITLCVLLLLFKFKPSVLEFHYTYLLLGILAFGPFLYLVRKRPALFPKLLLMMPFFFFLYLAHELVSLHLGLWSFPGHYIGTASVFGIAFPFEELFFWIGASSVIAASYHELWVDDQR